MAGNFCFGQIQHPDFMIDTSGLKDNSGDNRYDVYNNEIIDSGFFILII